MMDRGAQRVKAMGLSEFRSTCAPARGVTWEFLRNTRPRLRP